MLLNARRSGNRRQGFTLIELVVVVMILAILAGLVVNIVDWVRRSANYGAASHNQQSLLNNLQIFRTTLGNGKYPDRFDSLLAADGTVSEWLTDDLEGMIEVADISTFGAASLDKSGITTVLDHVLPAAIDSVVQGSPQNSGALPRSLSGGGNVAFLDTASTVDAAQELIAGLYPDGGLPPDVRIVLFGVGPGNTAVGRTIQAPPLYTELDPAKEYGRFVIAVAVYEPRQGRRAQIKAVLDAKGRMVNRNLSEFWQSVNNDNS
jgi:prepilin-type N-terminal cleavage/methylation domain-containing protein